MTFPRILIAGVGNVLHRDDAFGVEVARRLALAPLPEGVEVREIGVRTADLLFAAMDRLDALVIVDVAERGGAPGTLYLIDPAVDGAPPARVAGHSLDVASALRVAAACGGGPRRVLIVACEPADLADDGEGLSPAVAAAVEGAVEMARRVAAEALFAHA